METPVDLGSSGEYPIRLHPLPIFNLQLTFLKLQLCLARKGTLFIPFSVSTYSDDTCILPKIIKYIVSSKTSLLILFK